MACKCGKNENCKCGELLYIMNPNCGWCKKSDPVVAKLVEEGHNIKSLDVNNPEEAKEANEVKAKHNAQCGTPLFIDAKSGNMVCGFDEPNIKKWVNGEEIPAPPPRPNRPTPQQHAHVNVELKKFNLSVWQEAKQILQDKFSNDYEIWSNSKLNGKVNGNCPVKERPEFPTTEQIFSESIKLLAFCSR
ncbi:hypothetical protein CL614_04685 [archaeon]|nr:hypothetical protein [archaeon]|tara:strand:- start:695 stop:1261 length:567 start_codon:yes stop_codon:yes gene_type:complete